MAGLSDLIPKRAFSLEEARPGEKLHEVCVILKDIPGALCKVAGVFAGANINLKASSVFYIASRPGQGCFTSFVDMSRASLSINEIERELRKLDVVADVVFQHLSPVPFEVMHFPILHGDTRAVIMPKGIAWSLWEGLENILTPSGFAAVHYHAGKNTGVSIAEHLREKYGLEKKDLILAFTQEMKATGWGIIEVHDIDSKRSSGTIIVKECFEAAAWRKKPYNVCHWTRGTLAGFMSTVFGKNLEVEEVKCLATGNEYCEFKIQSRL